MKTFDATELMEKIQSAPPECLAVSNEVMERMRLVLQAGATPPVSLDDEVASLVAFQSYAVTEMQTITTAIMSSNLVPKISEFLACIGYNPF